MRRNHRIRSRSLRWFRVVDDSMRPALVPGDGLLAWRGGTPKAGQLRVFRDPLQSQRWLVKRVSGVRGRGVDTKFEVRFDNRAAVRAEDSRDFGWIPAAGSYRVLWTVVRTKR